MKIKQLFRGPRVLRDFVMKDEGLLARPTPKRNAETVGW